MEKKFQTISSPQMSQEIDGHWTKFVTANGAEAFVRAVKLPYGHEEEKPCFLLDKKRKLHLSLATDRVSCPHTPSPPSLMAVEVLVHVRVSCDLFRNSVCTISDFLMIDILSHGPIYFVVDLLRHV